MRFSGTSRNGWAKGVGINAKRRRTRPPDAPLPRSPNRTCGAEQVCPGRRSYTARSDGKAKSRLTPGNTDKKAPGLPRGLWPRGLAQGGGRRGLCNAQRSHYRSGQSVQNCSLRNPSASRSWFNRDLPSPTAPLPQQLRQPSHVDQPSRVDGDPSRLVLVSIIFAARSYQLTASNSMLRARSVSSTARVTSRQSGSVLWSGGIALMARWTSSKALSDRAGTI
jgi:hypothetical protein